MNVIDSGLSFFDDLEVFFYDLPFKKKFKNSQDSIHLGYVQPSLIFFHRIAKKMRLKGCCTEKSRTKFSFSTEIPFPTKEAPQLH